MSGAEYAAVIAAAGVALATLLGLFGGAIKYVVSLILDAYKRQAEATIAAKDRDLAAKDAEIARLHGAMADLRQEIGDGVQEIRRLLREWPA